MVFCPFIWLEAIEDAGVLIHDGARPMISAELIQKCIYYVKISCMCRGNAIEDTIKVVDMRGELRDPYT